MIGRKKRFKVPRITTVIGSEAVLKGDLLFKGGVHVDGTVHGNVIGEQDERSTLILSDSGLVEGDVRAPNVILNGRVVGDVVASGRVELAVNARVTGALYYRLLEMEMGAEVNGQLICVENGELPPPRLGYDEKDGAESTGAADSASDQQPVADTDGNS
ncbi:MAG: polymer-forming cytoskeletal protein [Gammaproteobacteria bacterium]|nr:polymer-forming cytoskeletal protein [Gammaproteobacteria bacterium]